MAQIHGSGINNWANTAMVDDDGRLFVNVSGTVATTGTTGGAGSEVWVKNAVAISGTIPISSGASLELTQSDIKNLIGTLNELGARLQFLGGLANAGQPALRVTPIASVSTAVTGPLTDAQNTAANLVSDNKLLNVGLPSPAIIGNINNTLKP